MPGLRARHLALYMLLLPLCGAIAGCWQLNRWSGPSQDPFFSIVQPAPSRAVLADSHDSGEKQDGGLSNEQTERASARH